MSVRSKTYQGDLPQGWQALLPCPFCNSPSRVVIAFRMCRPDQPSNGWAECTRCGATAGCFEILEEALTEEQMFRKIQRAWNRRGSSQNVDWKLARIAAILGSDYVEKA